jgi:molybdate transport repressor ModE-like protein
MPAKTIAFDEILGAGSSDKRLEVLRSVQQAGSISQAARLNGVSYKAAWQAVETLSNLAGVPLIEKVVGGSGGGGARLTAQGLALLRAAALLLVLALLLRPAVVVAAAVPQRNVLAVVVDDSRSMRAAAPDAPSRLAVAQGLLADSGALMRGLAARFVVRRFAGAASATSVPARAGLRGAGTRRGGDVALTRRVAGRHTHMQARKCTQHTHR